MSGRHKRDRDRPRQGEGLWVLSDVLPDGTYVVTINVDADRSWVLDRQGALAYAATAVEAAQRAEYDAAIFKLFHRKLGLGPEHVAAMLGNDIRPDRPPLNDAATAPLAFQPGVTSAGKAFLTVTVDGEPWGQLDPAALREHAMVVLEAPAAADLDAGLLRALRGMDIPEPTARAAVGDIANWRSA